MPHRPGPATVGAEWRASGPNAPHVHLLGVTRNTDNYGVRVLLTSAVGAIAALHPDAEIVLLDYGWQSDQWVERTSIGDRPVRLANLRFSWKLNLPNNVFRLVALALLVRSLPSERLRARIVRSNPYLSHIADAIGTYSIAGGDSFSDIYGMERFIYVTLPQILVLLLGQPLTQLPQTYGPFRGTMARTVARWILSSSKQIFSRDEVGLRIVHALVGSQQHVKAVPDLGFTMPAKPLHPPIVAELAAYRGKRPLVGLNVSRLLYIGGYSGRNMFGLREDFPRLMDELVLHLTSHLDCAVLLVPHVCGGPGSQEDETALCKRLVARLGPQTGGRVNYLDHPLDHQQMKTVIGSCDFFIGARMHACIAAVSQGVPTVCLAYSGKFSGVMQPLGDGARVVDLRESSAADTLRAIEDALRNRRALRDALVPLAEHVRQRAIGMNSAAGPATEAVCT